MWQFLASGVREIGARKLENSNFTSSKGHIRTLLSSDVFVQALQEHQDHEILQVLQRTQAYVKLYTQIVSVYDKERTILP